MHTNIEAQVRESETSTVGSPVGQQAPLSRWDTHVSDIKQFERLTGEGGDVIVVIWKGCVSLEVCVVMVARSTVKRGDVT